MFGVLQTYVKTGIFLLVEWRRKFGKLFIKHLLEFVKQYNLKLWNEFLTHWCKTVIIRIKIQVRRLENISCWSWNLCVHISKHIKWAKKAWLIIYKVAIMHDTFHNKRIYKILEIEVQVWSNVKKSNRNTALSKNFHICYKPRYMRMRAINHRYPYTMLRNVNL